MLKETETEETIVLFVTFLSLAAIQLGGGGGWGGPPAPLATPMRGTIQYLAYYQFCLSNLVPLAPSKKLCPFPISPFPKITLQPDELG